MKKIKSTQAESPILDVRDGVVITKDGRFVKILEVSPINFELRSPDEQNGIISQFASAIRPMPKTVQFKIVSKRSDVTDYTDKIAEDIENETNENIIALQKDQRQLISHIGTQQGVSRHFYIVFEYEGTGNMQKRPPFEDIVRDLRRQALSIKASMEMCGNDVHICDDSDTVMSILHSIMARAENEHYTFEERKAFITNRLFENNTVPLTGKEVLPVNDFLVPGEMNFKNSPNYVVIDGMYFMYCYLPSGSYPNRATGGWLQVIFNYMEGIDVDFFFHKEPVAPTQRKLQFKLKDNKIKAKNSDDTTQDYDDLLSAVDAGYYIKNSIAAGDEFCYMSTLVTITAHSHEELVFKYTELKEHLLKNDMQLKQCTFQQEDAWISCLPLAHYSKSIFAKSKRNIMSSQLASCYPFTAYEMSDEGGIFLGTNNRYGSPVFINNFDTKKYFNANMVLLGSSGSGKTFTLQCMALRMRQKGIQTFIIAPLKGHEFYRACSAAGGEFIRVAPGSKQNINIMEIRKHDDKTTILIDGESSLSGSVLSDKIQQLHRFFSLLIPDISYEEKEVLDECLIRTYANFGITTKNSSLYDKDNPDKYKKMPILGDLHKELKAAGDVARRMYNILNRYVSGSASSFNAPTNVNLDNKYVILDVSSATPEMLPICMFIALDYVWDKAREDRTKLKVIAIDEYWRLANASKLAGEFGIEIFKVIRGYGGAAIAATQDLGDLSDNSESSAVLNNAKIKMLLQMEPQEADNVAQVMDLTSEELRQIKRAGSKYVKGKCLLVANSNHLFVDICASEKETKLISTDATQLRAIAADAERERRNAEGEAPDAE